MRHHNSKIRAALSTVLVSLLMACGNVENNDTDKLSTQAPLYTQQQQLFCLTMLSNISAQYNKMNGIQDSTTAAINKVLADAASIEYIGNWQCVWGPVVFVDTTSNPGVAANTMFVAQQAGTANFVVAIAGTNSASHIDIWDEDLNAWTQNPWDASDRTKGKVSEGMQEALQILQAMTSGGMTASQYLVQNAASMSHAQVWVTGHSLGGTVGPMYALYLHDSMSAWAPQSTIGINCQVVAGASPGDSVFAAYYLKQMGSNTTRIWNTRDIIPHAFEVDMVNEVLAPTFYPTDSVGPMGSLYNYAVTQYMQTMADSNTSYTQLQPDSTFAFTSAIYTADTAVHTSLTFDTTFSNQWVLQHVSAYGVYFGTLGFQQAVQSVLGLPVPFFTDGAILVPVWK